MPAFLQIKARLFITMKKVAFTCICTLFLCSHAFSQARYEKNWVFSKGSQGLHLIFEDDNSLTLNLISNAVIKTREANISMSDKEGKLIFYSNNCSISNSTHELMENGEGLNPGVVQDYWCSINPFTNPYNQSILSIPVPGYDSLYSIFHVDAQLFNFGSGEESYVTPLHLLNTIVEFSDLNPLGRVISKNNIILTDTLASSKISAVKHANGRDWWIITPEYKSNCYYIILATPFGNSVWEKQCLGRIWNNYDESGGALFTPDGKNYIRSNDRNGLNIFDFDRCLGIFSNPRHISYAPDTNSVSGLSISPNGRFIYYNTLHEIFQFDLHAQEISGSKVLVASFDGFQSAGNNTDFYQAKLAPDGAIYVTSFGPTFYLHTIDSPDSLGVSCAVSQHSIQLPITYFGGLPNYPNYNLGAIPGSCDSINSSSNQLFDEKILPIISPNPTSGNLNISLPKNFSLNKIEIFDLFGKSVFTSYQTNIEQIIINPKLENGLYFVKFTGENNHFFLKRIFISQ